MNEEQMKHIANLISQDIEKDKEIARLNNIIDEIESILYSENDNVNKLIFIQETLDKIKELKNK